MRYVCDFKLPTLSDISWPGRVGARTEGRPPAEAFSVAAFFYYPHSELSLFPIREDPVSRHYIGLSRNRV
jgi:hypothetical protein